MSLTTVAELRSSLGVGTLYSDAVLQEVCDAADNVLLPVPLLFCLHTLIVDPPCKAFAVEGMGARSLD